jgi:hypothetical protein
MAALSSTVGGGSRARLRLREIVPPAMDSNCSQRAMDSGFF